MLYLLIQAVCLNTLVNAQRTFLPGIDGRFGGFGPGGPGFFGGGPPFGGPGFDFGPGPGAGGFLPDFPAIGGPSMPFTPPRGPPDFDRIRRENGGFPVWGGAGINREDGTRAFDGWDGDPAKLGVGSFSSQVGPSHILANQRSSSDDNSRDLQTVVQTTRVVVRPSPFRIPPRPRVTNQRETREQYTRSIAQIRRNVLSGNANVNQRRPQALRTPSTSHRASSGSLRTSPGSQRTPSGTQRTPSAPQRNSRHRRIHLNKDNSPMAGSHHSVQRNARLRDTGQSGAVYLQARRTQNAPLASSPLRNSRTHPVSGNNRMARHRGPLVYHQRFMAERSGDENDANTQALAIDQANWIPGPIPGLEMISNQRQNLRNIQTPGHHISQDQNNGQQPINSNSIVRNPTTKHQSLIQNVDQVLSLNQLSGQNQQTSPNIDISSNQVVPGQREPGPLTIIIDPNSIPNQNTLQDQSVSQQGTLSSTVNDQQGQPYPSNQRTQLHNFSPVSSHQGTNSDNQNAPGQHSMADGATGGIGGVFGPTGPATGGAGGRFADPTTGERIQVVSSDMANAVRQARVGGDPRAGGFGPGPVGQGVGTQGRFIPGRTFTPGPGPVAGGPGVGVGGPVRQFGGRSEFPRDRFMGPGPVAPTRTGAGLLGGPGGPIRIRIPADGGRPIVTRDGVSQPLPPGMSLADLGISSPPPVGPIRVPGSGTMSTNINNGFSQTGVFSNGTHSRPLVVGEPSMSNSSRLFRFQSGYGMFGRGRMYENLLSSLGGNYVQILLPAHRRVNNQNNNNANYNNNITDVLSANDRTIFIERSPKISNEPANHVISNFENVLPIITQNTPAIVKTTTTPAPTTSTKPQPTTTTPDIPEEIEPVPAPPSYYGNPPHNGDNGYMHLSKFQRTVAEMLGLPASHVLIRNLSMIETMAQRNGFEIELEGGATVGEPMLAPLENHIVAETTTSSSLSPITSASTLAVESIQTVTKAMSNPMNNIDSLIIPPDSQRNTNIENNLTQDGFLKTLNSLLMTGKRHVQVTFDTNTGVYKLFTRPVGQGSEWQSAHAPLRREHPSFTHMLTGFEPPPADPGLIGQPDNRQPIVTSMSGPVPTDMGHSHGSGLGEVHSANTNNNNNNNNNNVGDIGVNSNGAPDLLVIQMADLRNRDNLPAIMNALENIANAQGGGVAGPIGVNDRNNALGTRI